VKKTDKSKFTSCNHHPTVKPIALMEYLVKLVTPKDGICLDIFMGSGSTGIACANLSNLGFTFIGVEMEPSYFEIAKARIQHWQSKSNNRSVQIPLSHTQI
jgi:DNA modification methylase